MAGLALITTRQKRTQTLDGALCSLRADFSAEEGGREAGDSRPEVLYLALLLGNSQNFTHRLHLRQFLSRAPYPKRKDFGSLRPD